MGIGSHESWQASDQWELASPPRFPSSLLHTSPHFNPACNANARPVHTTHFSPHTPQVLSASDDTTVKLWDLSTQECITTLTPHTDYVRSALFHPTSPHLLLSGSYDSTIRLHDIRLPPGSSTTMTMRHGGAPVEDILAFPTGGVAVSVGGPILRVWDLNMGKCVRALSNHQKTITCAAFDGTKGRVMTGGLDAMVKVYDVEDWKVVHTMRYPAPLLSLAVSVSPSIHSLCDPTPSRSVSFAVSSHACSPISPC
jgi:U3 small nucleolar RNA-associated protein 15